MPDLGEELAYTSMELFAKKVRAVYKPGLSFLIVSDGHVFSDLIGVDDDLVESYGEILRFMVNGLSLSTPFAFHGLVHLLTSDDEASRKALDIDSVDLKYHLGSKISDSANDTRRILQLLFGSDDAQLHKKVKEDPHVNSLFRGFSKFLFEDLQGQEALQKLPSKKQRKELCSKLAYGMILRNQAYSDAVSVLYPLHVRISIHPHPNCGPKFGVNLIHASLCHRGLQSAARLELFHTPTPWHNVVVRDCTGLHVVMAKKQAVEVLAAKGVEWEVVRYEGDGRPSHLEIKRSFDDVFGTTAWVEEGRASSSEGTEVDEKEVEFVEVALVEERKVEKKVEPEYTAYSKGRRQLYLFLVASAGFLGPFSGNIYLPSLETIRSEFSVSTFQMNLTVTMFMLMFALAPLLWATLADSHGRRIVYITSLPLFTVSSLGLTFSPSYGVLMLLRILQAAGAAAVQSVGAGTIADLFPVKERGAAMSIFLLGPQLGPIVGPLVGGAVARYAGWRWIFVVLTVVGAIVWLCILLLLPETLRSRMGDGSDIVKSGATLAIRMPTRTVPLKEGEKKPVFNPLAAVKLLAIPSVTLCISYVSVVFGVFYAVTVEVPYIFSDVYGFSTLSVGLSYLGLGCGFVAGSIAAGRYSDWRLKGEMKRLGTEDAKKVPSEVRVRSEVVGMVLFPLGVILFGCASQAAVHPGLAIACMFVLAFGMTWVINCNMTYLIDSFPGTAASVVALNSLLRNPAASAGSALIAPLVSVIGYAGSYAILGALVILCSGMVVIVMVRGAEWRAKHASKAKTAGPGAAKPMGAAKEMMEVKDVKDVKEMKEVKEMSLKLALHRIRLLRDKKLHNSHALRGAIAAQLRDRNVRPAFHRLKLLMLEDRTMTALDSLSCACETLLARFVSLEDRGRTEPDENVRGAVATVLYAAGKVEVKELSAIRDQLVRRFGRVCVRAAGLGRDVDAQFVDAVKDGEMVGPDSLTVDAWFKGIAKQFEVEWDGHGAVELQSLLDSMESSQVHNSPRYDTSHEDSFHTLLTQDTYQFAASAEAGDAAVGAGRFDHGRPQALRHDTDTSLPSVDGGVVVSVEDDIKGGWPVEAVDYDADMSRRITALRKDM
ncbi:Dityrosine transporter 1 [Irineochytrium annulatum]|nr:Dityrosine transporter 1 [Irineochytrium annulatum]